MFSTKGAKNNTHNFYTIPLSDAYNAQNKAKNTLFTAFEVIHNVENIENKNKDRLKWVWKTRSRVCLYFV